MSVSTHARKAAKAKPLSNEEVSSLLNLLKLEVLSLRSACTSDTAEMQSLQMTLSLPPPTISSSQHTSHSNSSAYNRFMQEPYRAADCFNQLRSDGSNFTEWVTCLNRVLCVAFNSKLVYTHLLETLLTIQPTTNVWCPPTHVVNKFGASCFHCGYTSHWRADFSHKRGVAHPNSPTPSQTSRLATPDQRPQQGSDGSYQREHVSQVHFVKHKASNKVLIDTGASIHLFVALHFASRIHPISPFHIFFANSNSSILISQMTTLSLPVRNGYVEIRNVAYSDKISGMILFSCNHHLQQ
ncbi:hypothetical protein O181_028032 [Austropuccinia psidii MF-1]|uniref:Uncharacterized protein n=1 Tax=Austropuccinia psidii MF-1 TaxID=1389203 RepID=A0A9Q3CR35_9BASI|nr:hypothetical protein [Austropuccinia psidii MF-1]